MNAIIRWLQKLPDAYWLGVLLLITLGFLLLPWAAARWRDRVCQGKPQRKRRCAIWQAALAALAAFPVLFVIVGIVIWFVVLALPKPSFTEADDKVWILRVFKGVNDEGLGRICFVFGMPLVSFFTGMVYRALRWERVDTSGGDKGGHPTTTDADPQHSVDSGQTPMDYGDETGSAKG